MKSAAKYTAIAYRLPRFLRGHILNFETDIEDAIGAFAASLPGGVRVLDAGAGEGQYAHYFQRHRYCGVDLAVGDAAWDYSRLDAMADLTALPFRTGAFDAALHIVTIEHLREPGRALAEIGRSLKPGGVLLVAAPHEWEVHQAPHDYFRYTRYGLAYLLESAGFEKLEIHASGGYFPSSGAAAAQRTTILHRGISLAIFHSGRDSGSPTGADPAVLRLSRPGP
jgi:SAM-dependent methyltransferase